MKTSLLLSAVVSVACAGSALAQSTMEKIENKTKQAVRATGDALENAARKTGDAIENVTGSTEQKIKDSSEAATKDVNNEAKTVSSDVSNSDIYKKIEKELGKPLSPEQREKYAAAWQSAKDKTRAIEKEFAEKLSEITKISTAKTKQIVSDTGL